MDPLSTWNTVVAISAAGIVALVVGIALFVKKHDRGDRRDRD
jgi:hypothetical protein